MAIFTTDTEKARAEIERLRAAREILEQKATAAAAELAKLRADAGARELAEVLDGADGSEQRARIVALDSQVTGLAAARKLLIDQLAEAFRARYRAEAAEVREQARKLEGELDKHRRTTIKHLEALREHEGCMFLPECRVIEAGWSSRGSESLAGGGATMVLPRSEVMAGKIQSLLSQAAAIERRAVPLHGSVSGETLAELLTPCDNPDMIAPARGECEAWFDEASAAAESAWEAAQHQSHINWTPDERTFYTVVWRDGAIDRRESTWQTRGLTERDLRQAAEQEAA